MFIICILYTDYEHVELEREKLDPTKGFKRKRQTAIIEHFKMMDKTANDKIAPDNIENNKRIESYKRKIFMGRNGTLNDRLGAGITAGNKWYENFLLNEELSSKDKDMGKDSEKILQDFTKEPVLIGADVQALYPNLDGLCVAKIAANAVRETKVKFSGINYYFLVVYLLLVLGFEGMHRNGLGECIPRRKKKSNARSLASLNNRDMNNWDFTKVKLTPDLKIELLAMMIQVAVLAMTSTTCYSFAGNLYKQKKGLGIGLRASACLARICMCKWDQLWGFLQQSLGVKIILFFRYIDDLRLLLFPIKPGYRWSNEKKCWDETANDDQKSPEQRTRDELGKSMDSIWSFLTFTTEGPEDFSDKKLPTLDFNAWVEPDRRINYINYTKPMANNLVLQNGTALS